MLKRLLNNKIPLPYAILFGICPWLTLTLLYTDLYTTAVFFFLLAAITGLGYLVFKLLGFVSNSLKMRLAFAPTTGFIIMGAYFALSARFSLPIKPVFWFFSGLGIVGFVQCVRDGFQNRKQFVNGSIWLVGLSIVLAFMFYRPHLTVNGVELEDGRYTWIDVDATYNMAIAATIKMGPTPRMPGMAQAELVYHYAAYGVAGFLSSATGIDLAESMQVLVGVGLILLFLSTIGCSQSFGKVFGDNRFAASFGVLGLFFFGAYTSIFYNPEADLTVFFERISLTIPINFFETACFYFGHSLLWGLSCLTLVIGLLVVEFRGPMERNVKLWALSLIAAHFVPFNAFAAAGSSGILAGIAIILGWRRPWAWLYAAVALSSMLLFFFLMGVIGSETMATFYFDKEFPHVFFELTLWAYLGLGLMIYAFKYFTLKKSNLTGIIVVLLFVGYVSCYVLINSNDGYHNDDYPMFFLQSLIAMIAMVALSNPIGRLLDGEKSGLYDESLSFFKIARTLSIVCCGLLAIFSLLAVVLDLHYQNLYLFSFLIAVSSIIIFSALTALYKQVGWFRNLSHILFGLLLVLGFFSPYPEFIAYGLGQSETIYLSSGEYRGLMALRHLSEPDALIATNKHDIPEREEHGRSYTYFPVVERRILLEGYEYGEYGQPKFDEIKKDNDLLFSTTDAAVAKQVIDKYDIIYIVCRPETTLKLLLPMPPWLRMLKNTGSLTVYNVVGKRQKESVKKESGNDFE